MNKSLMRFINQYVIWINKNKAIIEHTTYDTKVQN